MLLRSKPHLAASRSLLQPDPAQAAACLLLGTLGAAAAVHGRWALPIAAWLYAIFLLRFTRTVGVITGALGVWAATALSLCFMMFAAGLDVISPLTGLCVVLGLTLVLPYLIDRLLARRLPPLPASLIFPAALVGVEFGLATLTPIGSMLQPMAPSQHDNLPLLQLASITGSYGITFVMAWFASVIMLVVEDRSVLRRARLPLITYGLVLGLVIIGGTLRLQTAPAVDTVRVVGVSAARSVDRAAEQDQDRRAGFAKLNADLLASTRREARAGAAIVVWSEAAAPVEDRDRPELLRRIGAVARETGATVLAGLIVFTDGRERNEAVLVRPDGSVAWTYQKSFPVPGLDDLDPGDGRVAQEETPLGRLAAVICYDADFPALVRQAASADLFLVPSNDWPEFGRTHTEKIAVRGVENGFSIMRQDSNGLSRAYDPYGRVLASVDYFGADQASTVAYLPTRGTPTVYGQVGDVFAWACLAGLVVLAGAAVIGRWRG